MSIWFWIIVGEFALGCFVALFFMVKISERL